MSAAPSPAISHPAATSGFTIWREGSLHAELKARYAAAIPSARVEAAVDGFVVDVVGPDELVEIQTVGFSSVRRKLERLVTRHRVLLVHPITVEKWLVVVDEHGEVTRRRRSPKRGLPLDLFDELVHIPELITHANFRIELALTCEEEIRGPAPAGTGHRRPRAWTRLDRRLVDVVDTRRIDTAEDLRRLLPLDGSDRFTSRDIVAASGCSKRLAMRALYCLERSGAVTRLARLGRFVQYGEPAAEG